MYYLKDGKIFKYKDLKFIKEMDYEEVIDELRIEETIEIDLPDDPLPNNIPCRTRPSSRHEYTSYGDCHTARPKIGVRE
ncbi:hypothetical protein LCGC14_0504200 [marine sediment metagenome]|uniref:Uncharacterized protein n=1 Tax=marine sediment metagenome TaxID=412755 RepID=A0A0F9S327_9ZZZZ